MENPMLLKLAVVVAILLAGLLVFAATRPNSFHVQRAASIQAPPDKIFPLINDFHSWVYWSPWEKLDPQMKKTYTGPPSGKGSVYEWDGSMKVGTGRMEIADTTPSSKVVVKLDFLKPMEGHNTAEFTLEPQGNSTQVTWAMDGPSPYVAKLMGIFVSMDSVIGKEFETGLANLKAQAEK
jgi:hypothetical protein